MSSVETSSLAVARSFEDLGVQVAHITRNRLTPDDDPAYSSFERWTADDGQVGVDLPTDWNDVETATWLDDQDRPIGAAVVGAPNVDGLYEGWETEGLFIGVSPQTVASQTLLDSRSDLRSRNCTHEGDAAFDGDGFEGHYAVWSGCGGNDTVALDLAANHRSGPGTLLLHVRLTSERDIDALTTALESVDIDVQSVIDQVGRNAPGRIVD